MAWLRNLIWSRQEARDKAQATKILEDLTRLYAVTQKALPVSSRPLLGEKVAANLRSVWEEGKLSQPEHVPQYGLNLYSEKFLQSKVREFWSTGMKLEERRDDASRLEAYALYIAAYYIVAMTLEKVGPSEAVWQIRHRVKGICGGAPSPFPNWER